MQQKPRPRTGAQRHQQQGRQTAVATPPGGLPQRVPPEPEIRKMTTRKRCFTGLPAAIKGSVNLQPKTSIQSTKRNKNEIKVDLKLSKKTLKFSKNKINIKMFPGETENYHRVTVLMLG